ncbi:filamentous hemagglutinin N-terminal domain-containing protein, partial [Hydrogenophaga sp.]|uniref:two-partner secretion domain-containing protein n=1 Tax=Hydrogenophaga sp. TaxID=1904254 RepID=UPI00356555FF
MNKHCHRIIFNAARGQYMVVSETATTNRPASARDSGTRRGSCGSLSLRLQDLSRALALAFGLFLALPMHTSLHAQIVADPNAPGAQRPTVLAAPNGTPVVNIQTPSAAGISRNTYQQFDVQGNGAILNNSRGNVQTQLGGWVQGNPWLAGGSARVILNEVNSANPSQLRGFIEVAGQRAEIVIANPAGIQIDGAGFVNASRATLTTGTPLLQGGQLDGYQVQRGTITIHGAGLDASLTDHTGILARAIELNAGVWAQDLKVVGGVNDISADHSAVNAQAATGGAAAPAFALDVSQLGGMYAGKIHLVGTEAG